MFKHKGSALSKKDIDNCDELPSYNSLNGKGLKLVELNSEFKIRFYNDNPKYCETCNEKLEYSKDIAVRKYCNNSCAATNNNITRDAKNKAVKLEKNCEYCSKKFVYSSKQKHRRFCTQKCQGEHKVQECTQKWLDGEHPGYKGEAKQICSYVRKYLHDTRGTACEECGWDKRHPVDGSVLTEIDHIDGDAGNNKLDNLKILCPNCHAMTPTFRARNKTSTRNRK